MKRDIAPLVCATALLAVWLAAYVISPPVLENMQPGKYCLIHSQCETPMEFLVQSNCPFGSLCIDNRCRVVCGLSNRVIREGDPFPAPCTQDSDCDCSDRGERTIECRCIENGCYSIEL